MINIKIENLGTSYFFILEGTMEIMDSKKIKEEILGLEAVSNKDFELDMANLEYIDSTGIALLLTLYKNLKQKGKKLYIKKLNSTILSVLKLTSLDELFDL